MQEISIQKAPANNLGQTLENNSPTNHSNSDLNELYLDYSSLTEKLNELVFVPQKMKYQLDEFKKEVTKELT